MKIHVTESQKRVMKALKKEMGYTYGTALDYFIKEQNSAKTLKVAIHELEKLKRDYELAIHNINRKLEELRFKLNNNTSNAENNVYNEATQKSIESVENIFESLKNQYNNLDEFLFKNLQNCFLKIEEFKQLVKSAIHMIYSH